MLRSSQRLRRPADFAATTKSGSRQKSGVLVVYLSRSALGSDSALKFGPHLTHRSSPRAGLIVGKAVGNSVVRHRVSRRIREQLRVQLPQLEGGDRLVVRALPTAGRSTSAEVSRDLGVAISRLTRSRRENL